VYIAAMVGEIEILGRRVAKLGTTAALLAVTLGSQSSPVGARLADLFKTNSTT
jgi:hypothetical protein